MIFDEFIVLDNIQFKTLSPFVVFYSVRFDVEKNKNLFFCFSLWFLSGSKRYTPRHIQHASQKLYSGGKVLRPSGGVSSKAVVAEERQEVEDCRNLVGFSVDDIGEPFKL